MEAVSKPSMVLMPPQSSKARPLVRNPQRSPEEAVDLLKQNPRVPRAIASARKVFGKVDETSAMGFATLSAYKSALRWDGRGEYGPYAVHHSKTIWRMVHEDTEIIHIPVHSRRDFRDFSKWRKDNPNASLKEYAKDRRIPMGEAEFRASNWKMEAGSLYNVLPALSEIRYKSSGKPQADEELFAELLFGSSRTVAQPPNSADPEQQAFLGEVRSALRASLCTLKDLHIKVVMMYHGLGKYKNPRTYLEIANELGCKKQNVHQMYSLAMQKLAANPHLVEIWKEAKE